MSELAANSLITCLKSIETETNVLKCLTNLRSIDVNSENINILRKLDSSLLKIEEDADMLDAMLNDELNCLDSFEQLLQLSQQQAQLASKLLPAPISTNDHGALKAAPQTVDISKKKTVTISANAAAADTAKSMVARRMDDITAEEFESISKTTRGRLTLPIINKINKVLIDLLAKKKKEYHLPRSKLTPQMIILVDEYNSKRLLEHGKMPFLTETEIRSSAMFEHGEATGRAALQTLRQLQRLKMLRSSGINTYY